MLLNCLVLDCYLDENDDKDGTDNGSMNTTDGVEKMIEKYENNEMVDGKNIFLHTKNIQ